MTRRSHWDEIYRTRPVGEVSWYQAEATISLELIGRIAADPDIAIIDVGAGASTLVDGLLDAGHRAIAVLDLAGSALAVAQRRLVARPGRLSLPDGSG